MEQGRQNLDTEAHWVVVFDAKCVLCSANAQFILKHDHQRRFLLASMQGEYGSALYRHHGIDPNNPETLIVVQNKNLLHNSDAIIAIYSGLGWPWRTMAILKFVPRFFRDPVYLWVARNRYKLFGKRDSCWLPAPEYRDRLI